jgi:DNA-binding NtrC family response regulator
MIPTTWTCLVVEDEAVIAMSLETTLQERGIIVAGAFSTEADALAWLERQSPDMAVIDVKLGDGECIVLIREPRRREVPFVIYSGLDPWRRASPEYGSLTWIDKPADHPAILSALERLAPQLALWRESAPAGEG